MLTSSSAVVVDALAEGTLTGRLRLGVQRHESLDGTRLVSWGLYVQADVRDKRGQHTELHYYEAPVGTQVVIKIAIKVLC